MTLIKWLVIGIGSCLYVILVYQLTILLFIAPIRVGGA